MQWALERFSDTWFPTCSAYYNMGSIREHCRNYPAAYEAYQKAADALNKDQISYQRTISGNLMWTPVHIDGAINTPN